MSFTYRGYDSRLTQLARDLDYARDRTVLERFFMSVGGEGNSFADHEKTLSWIINDLRVSIFFANSTNTNRKSLGLQDDLHVFDDIRDLCETPQQYGRSQSVEGRGHGTPSEAHIAANLRKLTQVISPGRCCG